MDCQRKKGHCISSFETEAKDAPRYENFIARKESLFTINRVYGPAIASASVQAKIRKIIESENPQKPDSDDKIAKLLKDENIKLARRTVAKYREQLGILSSAKRRQF